jgi:hypothetical protein
MKLVNISIAAAALCIVATSAHALKSEDRTVKANMQVEYTKGPSEVNSLTEMFTEAEIYGRLRSNMFWWDWENQNNGRTADNNMWGVGGSLVYKTGYYKGLGATIGFYGTIPMHTDNKDGFSATTNYGKAGKDTYHTRADGTEGSMGVVAEAYGEVKVGKTNLKVGRQGIDSMMLATNDTKMIPNTFEAAVVETKDIPNTTVRAGYIMSQKLRDHQTFHSVIASGADNATLATDKIAYNDDSGTHKGLSERNIRLRGAGDANPEMVLMTISNKSIPNLKLDVEYIGLNDFFNTIIAEANYQIKLNDGWSLTPGIRYLRQMDDGAGKIGGASISGTLANRTGSGNGYTDRANADGSILMGRLVVNGGPLTLTAGYSDIADKGDIIAPWRGFPTGGYTRLMAQVDWIANTRSWMIRGDYDFDKAGLIPGFKAMIGYENMNFDEAKMATSTFTDRTITMVDLWKTFKEIPNTEFKFRMGLVDAEQKPTDAKDYDSYNEYRFEVNYLF